MIDKVNMNNCVLCKACSNICPTNAISFTKNHFSFLYPEINFDKCVNCNKCERVCPALNDSVSSSLKKAYAVKNKDEQIRLASTSGGMFAEIAKKYISVDGYVCGAVLNNEFKVNHIISNSPEDITKMYGSKYAQSDINDVYSKIKELLEQNKNVLFSGCPCQALGLNKFLNKSYDNLLIMDFVCHGIPSQKMLDEYINHLENKFNSKIESIKFRDKTMGWHRSAVKVSFKNSKTYIEPITADAYMTGFLGNTTLKESCFNCPARNFKSKSDITVGDFWGAEVVLPNFDDNKGISAVIANTQKGVNLIKTLSVDIQNIDINDIIKYNRNILESPEPNKIRTAFYQCIDKNGYDSAIKNFLSENKKNKLNRNIKYKLIKLKHKLTGNNSPVY